MKELSFEKMEALDGGVNEYCSLICYWFWGGSGYQGDFADLEAAYFNHCSDVC